MEYIPTRALPAFALLLCQTKSFSSDPFLIIIPYKSRVNTLLCLQRAFHLFGWCEGCAHAHIPGCLSSGLFWGEVSRQLIHLHAQLVCWLKQGACVHSLECAHIQHRLGTWLPMPPLYRWFGGKIKTKFKLFSRLDKQTLGLLQSAFETGWKALEIAVYNGFVCSFSFQWNTDDSGTSYHHSYLLRIQMY